MSGAFVLVVDGQAANTDSVPVDRLKVICAGSTAERQKPLESPPGLRKQSGLGLKVWQTKTALDGRGRAR